MVDHLLLHRMHDNLPAKALRFSECVATFASEFRLPERLCSICGLRGSMARVPVAADVWAGLRRVCARPPVPSAGWPAFASEVSDLLDVDSSLVHPGATCGPPLASFIAKHNGYSPGIVNVIPPRVWVSGAIARRLESVGVKSRCLDGVRWSVRQERRDADPSTLPEFFELTPFSSVTGLLGGVPSRFRCPECLRTLPGGPDAAAIQRSSWNGEPIVALDGYSGHLLVTAEVAQVMSEEAPRDLEFEVLPLE